jgi:hypothetical protein
MNFPNPNQGNINASSLWLELADFYTFPHIQVGLVRTKKIKEDSSEICLHLLQYFNNWEDLVAKLGTISLKTVSLRMRRFNTNQRMDIVHKWKTIFERIKGVRYRPLASIPYYEDAMKSIYAIETHGPDC